MPARNLGNDSLPIDVIIAITSDPDGYKKKLAEIKARNAKANEAEADARKLLADFQTERDQHEAAMAQREEAVSEREAQAAILETELAGRKDALDQREAEIAAREAACDRREADIAEREQILADVRRKLSKLVN